MDGDGGGKRPADNKNDRSENAPPAKKPAPPTPTSTTQQQLQKQIQHQLQQQLQAQLQAAAERGQQASITPEQIQAQAQAMVQAAAQAQAVVAAAKSRGDGLVPMNAAQIATLSQIQAQAIVNARKATTNLTPAQIQTQIQLQAQALVHAHTQAQIQGGIYKGDATPAKETTTKADPPARKAAPSTKPSASAMTEETDPMPEASSDGHEGFDMSEPPPAANSPAFLQQLQERLQQFWCDSYASIQSLENQSEQDFKNHNDLPLARIKRIMKSDEDVRMISAEAPVLFAKACELFILDLSIRAFGKLAQNKRLYLYEIIDLFSRPIVCVCL